MNDYRNQRGPHGSGALMFPETEWAFSDGAPELLLAFEVIPPQQPDKGHKHPEPHRERELEED